MISKETVAHVAELAKLQLDDDALATYTKQLDDILGMVDQLSQATTTDVPVTTQSITIKNVMRQDVAQQPVPVDALLKNVPTKKGTLIQVPAILDKEDD